MPYASGRVALVWLLMFGLVALAGFGAAAGASLLLLVVVALVSPYVILRRAGATSPTTPGVPLGLPVVRGAIRETAAAAL